MIVESKYNIGDVVYRALAITKHATVMCPDCAGTKTWEAHLPNGEVFGISCQTCAYGYEVRGYIKEPDVEGQITTLTIGSIRIDTEERPGRSVEYMCVETGIGSGSIYHEEDLSASREDAQAALPPLVEALKIHLAENNAKSRSNARTKGPGAMAAHYRAQIRQAKRDIEKAERGLARESGKS